MQDLEPSSELSSDSSASPGDDDEAADDPAPDEVYPTDSRDGDTRSRRSRSPPPRSAVDEGSVNKCSDEAVRTLLQSIATPLRASCPRQDAGGGLGLCEDSFACSLDPLLQQLHLTSSNPGGLFVTQKGEKHLRDVAALVETARLRAAGAETATISDDGKLGILLHLSDLVVPPLIDCDMQCVHLTSGRVAKWWSLLTEPWRDFSLAFNGADVCFHESTCAALALARPPDATPGMKHLHVYTDGSEKSGEAGWAAVVVHCPPRGFWRPG